MLGIILFNVSRYVSQNNPHKALHLQQFSHARYDPNAKSGLIFFCQQTPLLPVKPEDLLQVLYL